MMTRLTLPNFQTRYRPRVRGALMMSLVLVGVLVLSGCGTSLGAGNAGVQRAGVEAILSDAARAGLTVSQIADMRAREHHIDGERGLLGIDDATAAARYQTLHTLISEQERMTLLSAQSAATSDMARLDATLQRQSGQGITSPLYDVWLTTGRSALATATVPSDYHAADAAIRVALIDATAMANAYGALLQLGDALTRLHAAGLSIDLPQAEYAHAQQEYAIATKADEFAAVIDHVTVAQVEMANDQAQALPYLGGALLSSFQQRVDLAHGFGEDVAVFQSTITHDKQQLGGITSLSQYAVFQGQIAQQMDGLSLPLVRGQARHDLEQMQSLLNYCDQHNITDYEYTSAFGFDGVQRDFLSALTPDEFQHVDDETTVLIENLRTMLANLADGTPSDQLHAADLALLQYNGLMTSKVLIISLREQAARAYENGHLALTTFITTGRPELPSPPGLWHVSQRVTAITFVSADSPDSPFWYAPTYINYALLYHDGGFYVHDAWWRLHFGPGSNLPHDDPHAFNGGSHGCVNVPLQQMAQLYDWTPLGTTVIVY